MTDRIALGSPQRPSVQQHQRRAVSAPVQILDAMPDWTNKANAMWRRVTPRIIRVLRGRDVNIECHEQRSCQERATHPVRAMAVP